MRTLTSVLIGLVVGYLVGIMLASVAAFVFDLEDIARFIAIGCGLLGALLGPVVSNQLRQ